MTEQPTSQPRIKACRHHAYMVIEPDRWRIRDGAWSSEPIPSTPGVWCLDCGNIIDERFAGASYGEERRAQNIARVEAAKAKKRLDSKLRYYRNKEAKK